MSMPLFPHSIHQARRVVNASRFSESQLIARFPFADTAEPTMVDVGAHVGGSCLPFALRGWRVVAFEPEPENRRELENGLRGFDKFVCVPKAVSDVAGRTVPFYVSKEHWGIHSLKPFHDTHEPSLTVETVRLDGALEELDVREVTVLKIDVEGADLPALRSFDFGRYTPELVMCEFMDERSKKSFGYDHHEMAAYLQKQGYAVFVSEWSPIVEYGRKGRPSRRPHRFLGCAPYPLDHAPAWGNLIAVVSGRARRFEETLKAYLQELRAQGGVLRRIGRRIPGASRVHRLLRRLIGRP